MTPLTRDSDFGLDPSEAPRSRVLRVVLAVTAPQSLSLIRGFPQYLLDEGWDVHVVVSHPPADAFAESPGVVVHRVDMKREASVYSDLRSLVAWCRTLRKLRPDLVVSGTPKAGLLGMISAWMLRVPHRVYMLRGLRLESERGLRLVVLWVMEWLTALAAHSVIAVSPSLRQEYVRRRLCGSAKIVVLGSGSSNGVNTDSPPVYSAAAQRAKTEASPNGELLVGFVARVSADKGIDTLLTAVRVANERGQRVVALIVGDDEPAGELAAAIRRTGIDPSHVVWCGQVPDPTPFYVAMDVLCLPTRREGFPNVVLEAAALGVPAVVTTATGAVDSVVDEETGLLFPPGDSESLVRCLTRMQDRDLRRYMGSRARERAVREFARPLVWQRLEGGFRDLVETGVLVPSGGRARGGPRL